MHSVRSTHLFLTTSGKMSESSWWSKQLRCKSHLLQSLTCNHVTSNNTTGLIAALILSLDCSFWFIWINVYFNCICLLVIADVVGYSKRLHQLYYLICNISGIKLNSYLISSSPLKSHLSPIVNVKLITLVLIEQKITPGFNQGFNSTWTFFFF